MINEQELKILVDEYLMQLEMVDCDKTEGIITRGQNTNPEWFKEKAEKYINDHNNPTVKMELFGFKSFRPSLHDDEQRKSEYLFGIENALRQDRVDRRYSRNSAIWLSGQHAATVTKIVGSCLANYGNQNKYGKFLTSEETVFLLETNKLELLCNCIPLSIQEAYKNILNNSPSKFKSYRIYKKLGLQSYKLKILRNREAPKMKKKRKINLIPEDKIEPEPSAKIFKASTIHRKDNLLEFSLSHIFNKLRESGPTSYQFADCDNIQNYFLNISTNTKKEYADFNLIIKSASNEFNGSDVNEETSNVHALCSDNSLAFYNFFSCNIPIL